MGVRFEGTIGARDYIEAQMLRTRLLRGVSALALALFVLATCFTLPFLFDYWPLYICIAIPILGVLLVPPLLPFIAFGFAALAGDELRRPLRGEAAAEGIRLTRGGEDEFIGWSQLRHFRRTHRFVILYRVSGGVILLPRSLFARPKDFGDFIRLLDEHLVQLPS